MVEAGVLVHAVLCRDVVEVAAHLGAAAEVLAPAVVLLEAELVGDRDRVDPDVGVAVDAPRAARLGLLVEHDVGDAEQLELHAHREAAEAAADDDDLETLGQFGLVAGPAGRSTGRA